MPNGFRIHSGTVNFVACDIDGYDTPGIAAVGDTAVCTVNVVDSTVGASRYNSLGQKIAEGPAAIQASQAHNTAPDRVNLHLTRVAIDPAVQDVAGQSIRVGSTVIDQFTQVNTTFVGRAGSPTVQVFEDFPTVISTTGLSSDEAFGASQVTIRNRITATGITSPEAFGASSVAHNLTLSAVGLPSDEAFAPSGIAINGFVAETSIPSDEAFGVATLSRSNSVTASSIASPEAFGLAQTGRTIASAGIATSEAFGTATLLLARFISSTGVPSNEAFGVATMSVNRVLVAAGLPTDEAFGAGAMVIGEPPVGDAPELVVLGRLEPSGDDIPTGTVVTATVGEWTNYPHESRTVWMRDDVAVLDTGWRSEVWTDTYTLTSDDVGHVVTADQQVRNDIAESALAAAQGEVRALLRSLPPTSVDHTFVFGPMIAHSDVWRALQATLKLWLPSYLRERERLSGRGYATLKGPRGWRVYTEALGNLEGDQFPLCVIVAPGVADPPVQREAGLYTAKFEMGVSILVKARDVSESIDLAAQYGAAVRKVLLDHGSLGGLASGTTIIGARDDEIPTEDERTLAAAETIVSIRVDQYARGGGGPRDPEPEPDDDIDPGAPTLGTVATTFLDLERV